MLRSEQDSVDSRSNVAEDGKCEIRGKQKKKSVLVTLLE